MRLYGSNPLFCTTQPTFLGSRFPGFLKVGPTLLSEAELQLSNRGFNPWIDTSRCQVSQPFHMWGSHCTEISIDPSSQSISPKTIKAEVVERLVDPNLYWISTVVHGSYGTPTTLCIPLFFYLLYSPRLISFLVCSGITLDSNGTFAPCETRRSSLNRRRADQGPGRKAKSQIDQSQHRPTNSTSSNRHARRIIPEARDGPLGSPDRPLPNSATGAVRHRRARHSSSWPRPRRSLERAGLYPKPDPPAHPGLQQRSPAL